MFDNIGAKIKTLAKVVCWTGIVASVIWGISLITAGAATRNGGAIVLSGLLVIVLGALASWVGSFLTYGFGEMVENSDIRTELAVKEAMKKRKSKANALHSPCALPADCAKRARKRLGVTALASRKRWMK